MAGSEQIVPTHATVIRFEFSIESPQLTIIAGKGDIIVPGRIDRFMLVRLL